MKNSRFLWLRWALPVLVVVVAALGLVFPASAIEVVEGGIVPQGATIEDDVILHGNNPRVDGTVNGLVLATAQSVTINGTVNGDALLFAQNVFINGTVNGNLITAGGTIEITGKVTGAIVGAGGTLKLMNGATVERNLIYGGYDLQIYPDAVVMRDLYAAAYQTMLEGEVQSDVTIYGSAVDVTGSVGQNAVFEVGQPGVEMEIPASIILAGQSGLPPQRQQGLRVDASSTIGGNLTYISPEKEGNQILGQLKNPAVYQSPEDENTASNAPGRGNRLIQFPVSRPTFGSWALDLLRNTVSLILLGLLFAWLWPGLYSRARQQLTVRPWRSLGMGFLWMVLFIPAMAVLIVALVLLSIFFLTVTLWSMGLLVGGVGLLGWFNLLTIFVLAATWGARLLAAYLLGRLILRFFAAHVSEHRFWPI
ncbi:MAG TPA: polymer-forming cytoskeletal protein, partial [Anaerolineaceae bacterium]|nr:polymer-forming cytoskeletal protein [Anaerolineaceae bacterium]